MQFQLYITLIYSTDWTLCSAIQMLKTLFEWTNWTESLPELICSFLSSVELSSEHAGQQWNCCVIHESLTNLVAESLIAREWCMVSDHSGLRSCVYCVVRSLNVLINGKSTECTTQMSTSVTMTLSQMTWHNWIIRLTHFLNRSL